MNDLLFISGFGVSGKRQLSFLHFSENSEGAGKPILRELGWDKMDSQLKRQYVYDQLKEFLTYPEDDGDPKAVRIHPGALVILGPLNGCSGSFIAFEILPIERNSATYDSRTAKLGR